MQSGSVQEYSPSTIRCVEYGIVHLLMILLYYVQYLYVLQVLVVVTRYSGVYVYKENIYNSIIYCCRRLRRMYLSI